MGGISTANVARGGLRLDRISGIYQRNPWGRTLYVSSTHPRAGDTGLDGRDIEHPLKTLAGALSRAQSGDTILVGANHVETITTLDGLNIPAAKVDLEILGLGSGLRRPKLVFSTLTTADFMISGAGTKLQNFWLFPGIDSLAAMVNCAAANCEFLDIFVSQDATYQVLDAFKLTAAANNARFSRLVARQTEAGPASCIQAVAGSNLIIEDCDIIGDYSIGAVNNATTAASRLKIVRNLMQNLNAADPCIVLQAAATGFIAWNGFANTQADAVDTVITAGTGVRLIENYVTNLDRETGKLVGTVSG